MGEIKNKPKFYLQIIWNRLKHMRDPCKKCLVRPMCSAKCSPALVYMAATSVFNMAIWEIQRDVRTWWVNFDFVELIFKIVFILRFIVVMYLILALFLLSFRIYIPVPPFFLRGH